ncbi:MAG: bifunctional proline dehydrogenase/L-glutamate gamma-semialdehyde dehydrogenase PutA [Pseudomonadota bacterium]
MSLDLSRTQLGHPTPDEDDVVRKLLEHYPLTDALIKSSQVQATGWIEELRAHQPRFLGLENLMHEYPISSDEGRALMQLAESVLRVPDADTIEELISDKLRHHNWQAHTQADHNLLGRASGWGAWLAEQLITPHSTNLTLNYLTQRLGEPVVRRAVQQSIQFLGHQFVLGETIEGALARGESIKHAQELFSFDMLGEGARHQADASRHFEAYRHAIQVLGEHYESLRLEQRPSISIKLSALHARYEPAQFIHSEPELYDRVRTLAQEAKYYGLGITIDAEEAERLELSVHLFERLMTEPSLKGWSGLGMAIQAYSKRIMILADKLIQLAQTYQQRLNIRLVKGAYWDSEIKRAQELGLSSYPVFTQKAHTDLAYISAAHRLLAHRDIIFPQFATHNALTIAQILALAGNHTSGYEFQRLHGMGERLYPIVLKEHPSHCRVYAPVGTYRDLLAYLVRRMLENGANSSFVYQITDTTLTPADLTHDPKQHILTLHAKQVAAPLPLPSELYGSERRNSEGIDLSDLNILRHYSERFQPNRPATRPNTLPTQATSLIGGVAPNSLKSRHYEVLSPSDTRQVIGTAQAVTQPEDILKAFSLAAQHQPEWDTTAVELRAQCLERAADAMEKNRDSLLELLILEAGKTLADALSEVREAVDFCRYYAAQARKSFTLEGQLLPGPTGESNRLVLHGRGVWLCISPWNFPLAIFIGQIAAALVSGNAVIAKPAESTPLIAYKVCQILHEAGIPATILNLLIGSGKDIGEIAVNARELAGIAFTGSTDTARWLNQKLAAREGAIVPLIAETGGQNAMLIDSTALLEHACDIVITSAFRSAGQRCSALRVLWIQSDIADSFINMLTGAMNALRIGSPIDPSTDIGPVINAQAKLNLEKHVQHMKHEAHILHQLPISDDLLHKGHFFPPHLIELNMIQQLKEEIFGPILHIIRFHSEDWSGLLDTIHQQGYGLTLGIQSRIDSRIADITQRAKVGNIYINRSMIGAVVGVQPFGGEGLSGTGPKAGGPYYLHRFAVERTISNNLTALGGNLALMSKKQQ